MSEIEITINVIISLATGIIAGLVSGYIVTKKFSTKETNRVIKNRLFMLYMYMEFVLKYIQKKEYENLKELLESMELEEVFIELNSFKLKGLVKDVFHRSIALKHSLKYAVVSGEITKDYNDLYRKVHILSEDIMKARRE